MLSTGVRRESATSPVTMPRRRVLAGLAGLPVSLVLPACTSGRPGPQSSSRPPTSAEPPSTAPATSEPTVVDARALEAAAAEAIELLAVYDATVSAHPSLGPVLAPYAVDHDTHLSALAERITLPTPPDPGPSTTSPPTPPASVGAPTVAPTFPGVPVPADPAAARAAIVLAERGAGDAAREAARRARDGEVARLLASIGASRGVHALLLGAPA